MNMADFRKASMRYQLSKVAKMVVVCLLSLLVLFQARLVVRASSINEHGPLAEEEIPAAVDIYISFDDDGAAWLREEWTMEFASSTVWYVDRPEPLDKYEFGEQSAGKYKEDNYVINSPEKAGNAYYYKWFMAEDGSSEKTRINRYYCSVAEPGTWTFTVQYRVYKPVVTFSSPATALAQIPLLPERRHETYEGELQAIYARPSSVTIYLQSPKALVQPKAQVWVLGVQATEVEVLEDSYVIRCEEVNGKESFSLYATLPSTAFLGGIAESSSRSFNQHMADILSGTSLQQQADELGQKEQDTEKLRDYIVVAVALALIIGFVLLFLYARRAAKNYKSMLARRSAGKARDFKNSAYSRNLPFHDSLPAAFSALNLVKDIPNRSVVVGAQLLEWIRAKKVVLQNGPAGLCIQFYESAPELSPWESGLYQMFLQASGPNRILEPNEFAQWSLRNSTQVKKWLDEYDEWGLYLLHEAKMVETRLAYREGVHARVAEQNARVMPPPARPGETATGRQPISGEEKAPQWLVNMNTNVYFTKEGRGVLEEVYGFRKYLQEFTILEERLPQEVQLWQRYLVFAQLLGIAVAVGKSFEKTYPASFSSDASSAIFLQAILSGLTDAIDKAWIEILTIGAKDDILGTR